LSYFAAYRSVHPQLSRFYLLSMREQTSLLRIARYYSRIRLFDLSGGARTILRKADDRIFGVPRKITLSPASRMLMLAAGIDW
jgi:hypothetical protein